MGFVSSRCEKYVSENWGYLSWQFSWKLYIFWKLHTLIMRIIDFIRIQVRCLSFRGNIFAQFRKTVIHCKNHKNRDECYSCVKHCRTCRRPENRVRHSLERGHILCYVWALSLSWYLWPLFLLIIFIRCGMGNWNKIPISINTLLKMVR